MRGFSRYLSLLSITIFISLSLRADEHRILRYNNLITQHLLNKQQDLTANHLDTSSSPSIKTSFMLRGNTTKIVQVGQRFTVTQKFLSPKIHESSRPEMLTFQRSFTVQGNIRRAWANDCQSLTVLVQDNTIFTPHTFRVCYLLDLETLNSNQWSLIKRSEDILQQNLTPIITSHDDYQLYQTLPETLKPIFKISPALIPKPAELLPSKMVTLATAASLLLGGYITIF